MGWASGHIAKLNEGETVSFRPRGQSMKGKIKSGQLCTVEPITEDSELKKGDIVLCKVRSAEYLHLIKAIRGSQFQIGNNVGGTAAPHLDSPRNLSAQARPDYLAHQSFRRAKINPRSLPCTTWAKTFTWGSLGAELHGWITRNTIYGILVHVE